MSTTESHARRGEVSHAAPAVPPVVDRAAWQAARDELLVREKTHTR